MQPFGMVVLAADPHVDSAFAAQAGATLCSLEKLLERSDVVVVACLLNELTRHLLNAERPRLMKPTAYLINVARGPIIDEAALIEVLREGHIAGAGLDVFEQEPPDPTNPILTMQTVIPTAHCLCWTDFFVEAVARDAISGIITVLSGRWPEFVVNPAANAHARVQIWMPRDLIHRKRTVRRSRHGCFRYEPSERCAARDRRQRVGHLGDRR